MRKIIVEPALRLPSSWKTILASFRIGQFGCVYNYLDFWFSLGLVYI
jgi:hypothetical protein